MIKSMYMLLIFVLTTSHSFAKSEVKQVIAYKSERRLELIGQDNRVIKAYKIMLGKNPIGH